MGFLGDLLILISVCLTIDGFCYENAENSAVFPDVAKKDHRQRLITSGLLRELSRFRLLPELLPPLPQALRAPFSFAASLRSLSAFWQRPPCMVSILVSAAKSELL